MVGYLKDKSLYIKVPKNGCRTFSALLERNGWQLINLFKNDLDLTELLIWGHLTEPNERHTKGVHQYLIHNPDIDINNHKVGKLLVSGVFDDHTYSVNMMLGWIFTLPITWIPLDYPIVDYTVEDWVGKKPKNGNDLTNDFFKENNIDLKVTDNDILNARRWDWDADLIRKKINDYKRIYNVNYQKIDKNFLEPDRLLYEQICEKFRKKYGSVC